MSKKEIQAIISNPDFYKQTQEQVTKTMNRLKAIETDLEKAFLRWDELDALVKSFNRD